MTRGSPAAWRALFNSRQNPPSSKQTVAPGGESSYSVCPGGGVVGDGCIPLAPEEVVHRPDPLGRNPTPDFHRGDDSFGWDHCAACYQRTETHLDPWADVGVPANGAEITQDDPTPPGDPVVVVAEGVVGQDRHATRDRHVVPYRDELAHVVGEVDAQADVQTLARQGEWAEVCDPGFVGHGGPRQAVRTMVRRTTPETPEDEK